MHTNAHKCTQMTQMHTNAHKCTQMHTNAQTHMHTHMPHMHTHAHTCTHTCTHMHTHTHTHNTHTTYTQIRVGAEEGQAAYTRGMNIVVLPQNYVSGSYDFLEDVVIHELWHINLHVWCVWCGAV
jgi:hypothetical protein